MIHPFEALIGAGLILFVFAVLLWPKYGLLSRWRFLMSQSKRSYLEDALKHIYECERSRLSCTLSSIAGSLSLKQDRVTSLLEQLKSSGLIRIDHMNILLTQKGREYALRMIRLHRIWESYLAEETGTSDLDLHAKAHLKEHDLDESVIEKLSEKLGNPRFDPHGEPIPTDEGDIPPERGMLLTELKDDQVGRIVQFEDDPENIYREIRETGLCLGMQIDSVSRVDGGLEFYADGFRKRLPLIAAAQIRVELLDKAEMLKTPFSNLLDLKRGEAGKVIQISREIHGQNRRRLLDLGIVPGSRITKQMNSASGNPVAYRIKGASIALRNEQAKLIHIEKMKE